MNTDTARLWTPANIVTVARICGVPLFVVLLLSPWPFWFPESLSLEYWKPWIATAVFIVLSATDGLDGYLARSRGEVTNFGKFIDPLADKILTTSALLVLIELHVLPSWPVLVILTREFIVAGIRMLAADKGLVIAASWYGKAKTVTQIIAITLFLIKDSSFILTGPDSLAWGLYILAWVMMIVAVILTIVSMLDYFAKARDILGFKRHAVQDSQDEIELAFYPNTVQSLLEELSKRSFSLGCAESLTAGLISAEFASIPHVSQVFKGAIVAYDPQVKINQLGVSQTTILNFKLASCQVAEEMVIGVQRALDTHCALAVTGVAGPGPDQDNMPQGKVCIAAAIQDKVLSQEFAFEGDRNDIRLQTAHAAFDLLLNHLPESRD